jgi:hypothetical protein
MTDCHKYKDLIEKVLDGDISDGELSELKAHTTTCPSCREELGGFNLMRSVVTEAFSSSKDAKDAGKQVLHRLSLHPLPPSRGPDGRWKSIAASILVAAGLALGFALGWASRAGPGGLTLAAQVPVTVMDLTGTVLVRHAGLDTWQLLRADSTIHLGDTFHSTGGSGFVLGLDKESTIEVSQNSMLMLNSYDKQTQFFLAHGECTADLESPHGPFFIETPHGRVEALGTEFTVTVD